MDKKIAISEKSHNLVTKIKKRIRVQTFNNDPSLTNQMDVEEADANFVIDKFRKTGISPFNRGQGQYLDLSTLPDNLFDAQKLINETTKHFEALPSEARLRFNNNPEEMFKFLQDPKNQEEAIRLGLLERRHSTLQNDELNDEKHATKSAKTKKAEKPSSSPSEPSES